MAVGMELQDLPEDHLQADVDALAKSSQEIKTVAAQSRVHGKGLSEATVRQQASFTIEAHDAYSQQRMSGGDPFFVMIRGCGVRVRSKVHDEGDGTYTVTFKTELSGRYAIVVSLIGESLPGSPFMCHAQTPTPVAGLCLVRGPALNTAVAREPQKFEVQFRDGMGSIAHAEELDVYVELESDSEDVPDAIGTPQTSTGAEGKEAPSPSPRSAEGSVRQGSSFKKDHKKASTPRSSANSVRSPRSQLSSPLGARSSSSLLSSHRRMLLSQRVPKLGVHKLDACREMREWVVTGKSPLIVRAGLKLDSARVCQINPGRRIFLLDFAEEENSMRALAALEEEEVAEIKYHDAEWRDTYRAKPAWLDGQYTEMPRDKPRSPRSPRKEPVGWVTVAKDGRELVTPNPMLAAGDRQQHMQAWARRMALDRSIDADKANKAKRHIRDDTKGGFVGLSKKSRQHVALTCSKQGVFQNELSSDPRGIGFAFGGIKPGRLHAHGRVQETHEVFYSIGLVGRYRLHVGLRQSKMPVPGSPFQLQVLPGAASAIATRTPRGIELPLRGTVGSKEGQGCRLELPVFDRMGNRCTEGGAKVRCSCSDELVEADTMDRGDGTYDMLWQSQRRGTFEVQVTIDGEQILGSPFLIKLVSDSPDLEKTTCSGNGLKKTRAGEPSTVELRLVDQYENAAVAGPELSFGITLVRSDKKDEKNAWRTQKSDPYEGAWFDEVYRMLYHPEHAGDIDLYLWSDQGGNRSLLPQSPWRIFCTAGDAHAAGSRVDGFFTEEVIVEKGPGKKGPEQKSSASSSKITDSKSSGAHVGAGETIVIKPLICDAFGNPAAAGDNALSIGVVNPEQDSINLEPTSHIKGGLTSYEARFEPRVQGEYLINISLANEAILGSPLHFTVRAGVPDVAKSRCILPEPPLYAAHQGVENKYEVKMVAVDKYENECTNGGAIVTARLGGPNLPQGQDTNVPVRDLDNGTYILDLSLKSPADIKLIITVAREKKSSAQGSVPGQAAEFPPISMSFTSKAAALAAAEREAKRAGVTGGEEQSDLEKLDSFSGSLGGTAGGGTNAKSAAARPSLKNSASMRLAAKNKKLAPMRDAGQEIMSAFGRPEERREKKVFGSAQAVVQVAVEAMQTEVEQRKTEVADSED